MKTKIKEIYNLKELSNAEDTLVLWYNKLLNKNVEEITVFDIGRMIRQKVLVELALEKAINVLIENPFAGESNGDVLEHVLLLDETMLSSYKNEIKKIIKKAEVNANSVAWWYPEEKDEYRELLGKLKKIIN